MSKIVLMSLIGQSFKKAHTQNSLPNILFRLSPNHGNHFAITTSSLHIDHRHQQYILNNDNTFRNCFSIINKNNLYSDASLGLYKLDSLRENRMKLYETGKERYIDRIAKFIENSDIKSIFKDDLINLIALADNEQHLNLIEKIAKATKENDDLIIGSWGSAVMRLYYKMNLLDRALNNLRDVESFGDFFNQRTSYQIVMTMLFNSGRYQDVIDIYKFSVERLQGDTDKKFATDRRLSVLAFAAYAKLNTPQALEEAQKLYAKDQTNPYMKMRVVTFLSYLAVNQDKPAAALNLLSDSPHKNYISAREIKTISLIKLKRYEDVLYHIRESIAETKREFKIILQEVCDLLTSRQDEIDDEQVKRELMNTLVELKDNQLIGDATLHSIVYKEINQDQRQRLLDYNNLNGGPSGGMRLRQFNNRPRYDNRSFNESRNDRYPMRYGPRDGAGGGRFNRSRGFAQEVDEEMEGGGGRGSGMYNRGGRSSYNTMDDNNGPRQRGGFGRNRQAKSYFEDDLEEEDLDEVNVDKRFR